jgi:hypothetical protein
VNRHRGSNLERAGDTAAVSRRTPDFSLLARGPILVNSYASDAIPPGRNFRAVGHRAARE